MPNVTHEKRKAKGLCLRCGKRPPRPALLDCEACAQKLKVTRERLRQERKSHGMCANCGKERARRGKVYCQPCQTKANFNRDGGLYENSTFERRRQRKVCLRCGQQRPRPHKVHCAQCAEKLNAPRRQGGPRVLKSGTEYRPANRPPPTPKETWDFPVFSASTNPDPWRPGGMGEVAMYMMGVP